MKQVRLISFFLLTGSLLFNACKEPTVEYPVVEVEEVSTDNVEIYGDYVGSIRAIQSVEIRARVEGFLERITFDEGKQVHASEPPLLYQRRPLQSPGRKSQGSAKKG